MPLIDILMATFNGERYIEAQIDTLLSQDFSDFRLLVRDDASTDKTVEMIKRRKAADDRIVFLEDDLGKLGPQRSFMRLLEVSELSYFMFCDQDDIWMADKITKSLAVITGMADRYGNDKPLVAFTDLTVCDEILKAIDDSFWHYQRLDPSIARNWKKLLAQNVVTGCAMIGNALARHAALPFVLTDMMHDHWVAVNAARSGHIEYLSEPTVLYRQHFKNAEGARQFGTAYAAGKLGSPGRLFKKFRAAGTHFKVSPAMLAFYKLVAGLPRLFRRNGEK